MTNKQDRLQSVLWCVDAILRARAAEHAGNADVLLGEMDATHELWILTAADDAEIVL